MRRLLALLCAFSLPALASDFEAQRRAWNQPQAPVRIAGDTWYVGTAGLSAILIRGDRGAVLIDAALPESVPHILANLAALGVQPHEVKLLLNSHAHVDHAGGLAELQRSTGARLMASPASAALLRRGGLGDAQYGDDLGYPAVLADAQLRDGQVLRLGRIELTAHFTPGHTPGSTSWSWREIEDGRALDLVYADSLSAPGYRLLGNAAHPDIVADYRASFARLRALPCAVLLTPHPDFFGFADKLRAAEAGETAAFARAPACGEYVQGAATRFEAQLKAQGGL